MAVSRGMMSASIGLWKSLGRAEAERAAKIANSPIFLSTAHMLGASNIGMNRAGPLRIANKCFWERFQSATSPGSFWLCVFYPTRPPAKNSDLYFSKFVQKCFWAHRATFDFSSGAPQVLASSSLVYTVANEVRKFVRRA